MVPDKTPKTGRQTFMSEPLTSHEIEDVLSSIRRLVSEDLRPARAAPAAPEPEKLLLTPALRVVSPEPAEEAAPLADEAPFDAGSDWPEPETAVLADLSPAVFPEETVADEARVAETGAEEAGTYETGPEDAAPAFAAFTPPPPFMSPPHEAYDDAGMEDAALPLMEGEDEIIWASAGETDDAAGMVEDLVEPLADPAPLRGHWTAQDVPGPMDWVQEETDWVEPDPIPFVAHPRKLDLAAEPLARAWADAAEAAVHAELAEAAAGIAEVVIPPAPPPEPEVMPEEAEEDTAAQGLLDEEETRIDEAMLREIVRDIIREELAGSLGERITRNVRKLVRVEINRALAAREFE